MNKKVKKKLDALRQKTRKLEQGLAGARRQMDDPGEVARMEKELAELREEIRKLAES